MSKYIQELMSPQLMMAIYLFVGFIAALYILSVVYVFIDAKRRGVNAFWAWGIVSLIPFVGLIAGAASQLLYCRPRGARTRYGAARAPACPVR